MTTARVDFTGKPDDEVDMRAPGVLSTTNNNEPPSERKGGLTTNMFSLFKDCYGRLKFVLQCVDFSAPDKIGRNFVEMAPHCVIHCTRGRGKCGCRRIL